VDNFDQEVVENKPAPKQKKLGIFFMSVMAMAFAWIISKHMIIPSWIIVTSALIGGIVLFSIGLNKPHVVTYVLVAYLPFSKELAGDFGGAALALNLTNLLMFFIFVVWMTGKFAEKESLWISTPLNFSIFLFITLGFIAVCRGTYFGTGYLWLAVIEYKRWITPILMFFLVLNTVKDRTTIKSIVVIMIVVTTVVGLMAIRDYLNVGGGASMERSRIGGIADQPNMLAAFFNYYMFLPLGFFLLNKAKAKYWLLLIPFLIQFRGIMVTFSRGGYVAFAAALYAIIFIRSKMLFFVLIILTCLAIMNPQFLPPGIRYRMGQTFSGSATYGGKMDAPADNVEASLDSSAAVRIEIWKGAFKMIKENPWLGIGYGLFIPMSKYYWSGGIPRDAHNTYLIIAAEMGIPTLIVFLLIVFKVIFHTYSLYKTTADPFTKAVALGFLGGLFGLLASNMFGSRLDSQEVSSYFWILAALVMRFKILDAREGTIVRPQVARLDTHWLDEAEEVATEP